MALWVTTYTIMSTQEASPMTTIPQVARALRDILTTTADRAARDTRFVQRTSPLGGATLTQTLVFGFLGNRRRPWRNWPKRPLPGGDFRPQALDQRFTPRGCGLSGTVLDHAITRVGTAAPVAVPLLARFTAVYVQDSSTIILPDALAPCGKDAAGARQSAPAPRLNSQSVWTCALASWAQLQAGRASDHAPRSRPLPAGSLRLADLGYWSLACRRWANRTVLAVAAPDYKRRSTARRAAAAELLELLDASAPDPPSRLTLGVPAAAGAVAGGARAPGRRRTNGGGAGEAAARKAARSVRSGACSLDLPGHQCPPGRLTLAEELVLGRCGGRLNCCLSCGRAMAARTNRAAPNPGGWCAEVYCEIAGDGGATLADAGKLLGLSGSQPAESGADGAQTRAASGERLWRPSNA